MLFSRRGRRLRRDFSTVCAVAGLVASFATTEAAEAGMTGSVLFSRRDWHDMIYIWNSAFFALFAWNRGRICAFFHAEVADYAEIFGTVFVVAVLGYVLRSLS